MSTLFSDLFKDDEVDLGGVPQSTTDDDFEVLFSDDPAPMKGQNETGQEGSAADGADPDFFEDPRFLSRLSAERSAAEDGARREHDVQIASYEKLLFDTKLSELQAQRDSFKLSIDSVDAHIKASTQGMIAAREDDDAHAEVTLQQRIAELQRVRTQLETNFSQLPSDQQLQSKYEEHVSRRRQAAPQRAASGNDQSLKPLNDKAQRWQTNNAWMTKPENAAQRAAVKAINDQLVGEGVSASDDRFYSELSTRLAKLMPTVQVRSLDGRALTAAQAQPAQAPSAPVASARPSATPPNPTAQAKRVKLDAADRSIMKALRIDVNDKAAVQRYAREKFHRIRQEAAQGGR